MKKDDYVGQVMIAGQVHLYRLRRSRRAKRIVLKVDSSRGIELVVPWRGSYQFAENFLHSRTAWLEQVLERQPLQPQRRLVTGEKLPLLGREFELQVIRGTRQKSQVQLSEGVISVTLGVKANIREVLTKWYREQAQQYFTAVATELAAQINQPVTRISIRQAKTRWGSCSSRGVLSFNWRLLLGPEKIAKYVAVHEVAHLQHQHHQASFWQLVYQLDPEYQTHRAWLKQSGSTLIL